MSKSKKYELYTPNKLSKMSESSIRKEYSKLRSVANKRLQRLQAKGINMAAMSGYRFPTISNILESSRATVASELADVSRFLRDYRSTVRGEQRFLTNFQESLTSMGYGDLVQTNEDIYNTIHFLEDVREEYSDKLLPSGDALDALAEAERLNMPYDMLLNNIDLMVANMDKLERVQPTKGGRTFSKSRMNALIRKWS